MFEMYLESPWPSGHNVYFVVVGYEFDPHVATTNCFLKYYISCLLMHATLKSGASFGGQGVLLHLLQNLLLQNEHLKQSDEQIKDQNFNNNPCECLGRYIQHTCF